MPKTKRSPAGADFPTEPCECGAVAPHKVHPADCLQCLNTDRVSLPAEYADQALALGGTVKDDAATIPCPYCTDSYPDGFPGLNSEHIPGAVLIEPFGGSK